MPYRLQKREKTLSLGAARNSKVLSVHSRYSLRVAAVTLSTALCPRSCALSTTLSLSASILSLSTEDVGLACVGARRTQLCISWAKEKAASNARLFLHLRIHSMTTI